MGLRGKHQLTLGKHTTHLVEGDDHQTLESSPSSENSAATAPVRMLCKGNGAPLSVQWESHWQNNQNSSTRKRKGWKLIPVPWRQKQCISAGSMSTRGWRDTKSNPMDLGLSVRACALHFLENLLPLSYFNSVIFKNFKVALDPSDEI